MTDDKEKKDLTEEELKNAAGGRIARGRQRSEFEEGSNEDKQSDVSEDA